ncbi:MAG: DUF4097 domain-containing protein [Marinilabiliales bacterium]|nr:DUF4097 domain-containing protein [Marinilabiliales bacterium]
MKTPLFKWMLPLLLLLSIQGNAERISKRIYKSYPVSQVTKLQLSNKYGNIRIDDNRKDSVVIDVEIWVEGNSNKAKRILDNIGVNFGISGGTVSAETEFENSFNNFSGEFSIDYRVSVPANRDLEVSQKYGNVNMNDLTGKGLFDIKYGELKARSLLSPQLKIEMAYSKGSAEASNNMELSIRYSKFSLSKCENLTLDSRYSGLTFGEGKAFSIDSRYDDIRIKTAESLNANSMYTGYKIEKVLQSIDLVNGYGDFTVNSIPATFKSIKVSSKYAGVRLGIEQGASYKLDGNVQYCELKHPSGKLNRMREDTRYEVHGTVGEAEAPKATVSVESNYGNVNLMP